MKDIRGFIHRKLWDQVPLAISIIDRDFRIVEANRSFSDTYGRWRNRRCYQVYKGLHEHCARCAAVETFADGRIRVKEEAGRLPDGKRIDYLVHMVPIVRSNGEIAYVIEMSTDITATKVLEREKLEAERLAVVGQTVAGLAHGIKNVLMGLDGGVYVVRSGMQKGDSERILQGWQMVEENIARISSFAKEFLEFARGHTPRVQPIDPNRVAAKVVELFVEKARLAGISLRAKLGPGVSCAMMDEEGIHTCLVNLVSNALDACEISDKPGRKVVLGTHERAGKLVFEVSDDGTGMDYEVKKRVFTNFFSTKASGKGTGLGLLTTRKIVQEHGGTVSFRSTRGHGSIFRLVFARSRLPRPAEEADQPGND
ncbi:MAG: PAS domain-containing protein [Candidatus Riflebacteria bacterium]|nr:PAS domain-containing protein [Candidatus Riflebacteria bacterium]